MAAATAASTAAGQQRRSPFSLARFRASRRGSQKTREFHLFNAAKRDSARHWRPFFRVAFIAKTLGDNVEGKNVGDSCQNEGVNVAETWDAILLCDTYSREEREISKVG